MKPTVRRGFAKGVFPAFPATTPDPGEEGYRSTMSAELSIDSFKVFATGLDHPECCAFDRQGYLWAGGEAGQIYRIDPDGEVEEVARLGSFCGGMAFSPHDELFVCNPTLGVVQVTPNGTYSIFSKEAAGRELREPNFPAFDRFGNLFVSDSGSWNGRDGRLVCFDSRGIGTEVAGGFGYANGLVLSAHEDFIFMVESDSGMIYRIALAESPPQGRIERYAGPIRFVPDGVSLDSEGNLYVTAYGSHQIFRVSSDKQIRLLAHDPNGIMLGGPTNLVFGGPDCDEIFVANLNRWAITRAKVGRKGLPPANLRFSIGGK